ncbi:MAG: hypothetical protein QOE90_1945 [Thermoplasmata archaeon]|nr:hypothetical protein [Thermoplasmata archaeon]
MRGWILLALALVLVVPGCATPSAKLDAAALPRVDGAPLAFAAPKPMDQPTNGAEPNLAIGKDGTTWIAAVAGSQERPNAMQGAAWLWRSKDHGATWETLRSPQRDTPLGTVQGTRRPFGSSDADVVTAGDGWVYYTDWWNWGSPVTTPLAQANSRYGSYLVEASGDGGATWSSAPVTTLDSVGGIDRQWLVAGPDGTVGIFYAYFHGVQNTVRNAGDINGRGDALMSIESVWSTDHGATWSAPVTVVPTASNGDYQIAHPRYVGNGTYVMPYGFVDWTSGTDDWHNPSQVRLAVSRDNGTSWHSEKVADAPEGFDNLWAVQGAVDDHGRVLVAWAARTNQTMTLFASESADLGRTWSAPAALRSEGLNFLPWVAARGDGEFAVGWYGGDGTGDPGKAPQDAKWFAYVAHRPAEGAAWGVDKASLEPVKTGPMCPKGAACTSDREELDYLSVAFAPDGKLGVAFAKSRMVAGAKAGLVEFAGALG